MVGSMSSSGQMVMPPRWSNGFVSRDLILRDDWEDEMNDTSTPKCSDEFFRDQSSLHGGRMWNFAALIEYIKSADAGFIPIEGDIKVEDAAVVSDAGVEEMTLNGVSIGAKEKATDIFGTTNSTVIQASWPFVDDVCDESQYFQLSSPSAAFIKAEEADVHMNYNQRMSGKWDLAALREYLNASDGCVTDASPAILSKGILAPVKVRTSSLTGASGDCSGQPKDRRSVRFCEVVDVYPIPLREESTLCRINREHAKRATAMVESADGIRKSADAGVKSAYLKPGMEEFVKQRLERVGSSDDSPEEGELRESSLAKKSEAIAGTSAPNDRRTPEERKSSQIPYSPLEIFDRNLKKRARVSSESDTDHARQPAKKKAKRAVDGEQKWPGVVDSKQAMQEMLDKHCSIGKSGEYSHSNMHSHSQSQSQSHLSRRGSSDDRRTAHSLSHPLSKKTAEGAKPSSVSAHMRPVLSHRRPLTLREAERQRIHQNREKEREKERSANRQQAHKRLPPSLMQFEKAMREKRMAEDTARRGFFRLQYEMVAGANRSRDDRQDTNHFGAHSLQKVTPLVEVNEKEPWTMKDRYHTSVKRIYESEKPTIDPFLPVVRVYIDGEDSEMLMTHRLFRNLTVKSFKVARQAGLVEVENERRMFPERPDGDKSCRFKYRSRCMHFKPNDDRSRREPATDKRHLTEWNRRKVARIYDKQIDEDQNVGADADCFLKNVMSVLLHIPHSPFGDIPQSKNDMMRGVQQTVYAKKMKATGYERFLSVTLPLRGKAHHLHELAPPPPKADIETNADTGAGEELSGYDGPWTDSPWSECLPPLPDEQHPDLPPPPPPPSSIAQERHCPLPGEL